MLSPKKKKEKEKERKCWHCQFLRAAYQKYRSVTSEKLLSFFVFPAYSLSDKLGLDQQIASEAKTLSCHCTTDSVNRGASPSVLFNQAVLPAYIFSVRFGFAPRSQFDFSRMSVHCICTERTRRKRCGYWLVRAVVLLLHPEPETSSFFYPNGTASVPMYVYCIQRGGRQQPSFTPLAARGNGEQALVASWDSQASTKTNGPPLIH